MILVMPSLIKQQVLKIRDLGHSKGRGAVYRAQPVVGWEGLHWEAGNGEFRHKANITFNDNDTVSFVEHRSLHFQPDRSHGSESDYIILPNILVLVNYWHSEQCNMINGTSGQMWAPFMTPQSSLEFFSPEACRSMKLTYHDSGVFEGIPTYRFTAPKTLFANGSVYPPNEGFCPCLESGIQNVSTCRFGAPLFLSHPHFYNADPVLSEAVLGLNPDPREHSLFLDIHPRKGRHMGGSCLISSPAHA
ncbi:scavenger receptor class B member 1 [Cricetulus griseus]|nr:scavenger receptor class B member 1 [Cricetulus griseus]